MSTKENGGAAFGEFKQDGECAIKSGGITVRDYFAAKAMQGMCAVDRGQTISFAVEESYRIADAMLQERAK